MIIRKTHASLSVNQRRNSYSQFVNIVPFDCLEELKEKFCLISTIKKLALVFSVSVVTCCGAKSLKLSFFV